MVGRKLIYVAHKYGGNDDNIIRVEKVIKTLVSFYKGKYTFVSPLHTFGFLYNFTSYDEGFEFCKDLLMKVDELWLCKGNSEDNGWEDSIGCNREYGVALGRGIPIKYVEHVEGFTDKCPPSDYNIPFGYECSAINIYDENKELIETFDL